MATRSERAEAVRQLLREARHGLLSTAGLEPPGHPYGSLVQLATTGEGEPLLLVSPLAQHTKNLVADPRGSVLVTAATQEDPMQAPRATILGSLRRLEGAPEGAAREGFLARHPSAGMYFDLGFELWSLRPAEARYIAGFGSAAWVPGSEILGP